MTVRGKRMETIDAVLFLVGGTIFATGLLIGFLVGMAFTSAVRRNTEGDTMATEWSDELKKRRDDK